MAIKIFISHSAADEVLAGELVDCLLSSMVLEDDEVRCTSVPGHKLPVGSEVATTLRDELDETGVVVGLLTKNAIKSSWVFFELGATWGAKKSLMPLLSDDIDFKVLPGPLSGHHAVKLSDRNGLSQFLEEITNRIGGKKRSSAKIDAALDKLVEAAAQLTNSTVQSAKAKTVRTNLKEPTISGMPFSELLSILRDEKITMPGHVVGKDEDHETTLFEIFVGNYNLLAAGLQSNWEIDSPGGYMYHEVGVKLLTYDLVKFEKLPAAQAKWFERLRINANGKKFIAHYKRIVASEKKSST